MGKISKVALCNLSTVCRLVAAQTGLGGRRKKGIEAVGMGYELPLKGFKAGMSNSIWQECDEKKGGNFSYYLPQKE